MLLGALQAPPTKHGFGGRIKKNAHRIPSVPTVEIFLQKILISIREKENLLNWFLIHIRAKSNFRQSFN